MNDDEGVDSLFCLTPEVDDLLHNYAITGSEFQRILSGDSSFSSEELEKFGGNKILAHVLKLRMLLGTSNCGRFVPVEDLDEVVGNPDGAKYIYLLS